MDVATDLDRLEVFYGEATVAEARVYARMDDSRLPEGCQLTGRVVGPNSEFAHTLKVTAPLVDQGPGGSLLAQAILTDPCFWTPEQPYDYRVDVELRRGGECIATAERRLAIRRLGVHGRRLVLEGKAWVIRGVCHDEVSPAGAAEWRDASAVMSIDHVEPELFEDAARQGVLIMANVAGTHDELLEQLHRLKQFGAVGIVVVKPRGEPDETLLKTAGNLLLAQTCSTDDISPPVLWADTVVCDVVDSQRLPAWLENINVPVLARRRAGRQVDLVTARSQCDRLQRDLAGRGDFAGYIV